MNNSNKFKSGFTLVELLVFFVFISLVLAASTPIITRRVKELPRKIPHGMYICETNDAGGYTQSVYNSTRRIKSEDVTECHFEPPKRASVFKIELIGAGAGGYNYAESSEGEDWHYGIRAMGDSSVNTGVYRKITDAELRSVFNNAEFRAGIVGTFANATAADKVELSFVDVGTPELELISPDSNDNKISECKAECFEIKDISEYLTCTSKCYDTYRKTGVIERIKALGCKGLSYDSNIYECHGIPLKGSALEAEAIAIAQEAGFRIKTFDGNQKAIGFPGSESTLGVTPFLAIKGKLDFCDYSAGECRPLPLKGGTERYLACLLYVGCTNMEPGFEGGYALTPAGENGECPSLSSGVTRKLDDSKKKHTVMNGDVKEIYGQWGEDVISYRTVRIFDKCVSVKNRATGAQGGIIKTDSKTYIMNSRKDKLQEATPSSGTAGKISKRYRTLTGGSGSGSNIEFEYYPSYTDANNANNAWVRYPVMLIDTRLNKLVQAVGSGGSAGNIRIFHTTNLKDDCILRPARGGRALEKGDNTADITRLEEGLITTLSCNNGTYNIKSEGGSYNKTTQEKIIQMNEYVNSDGSFAESRIPEKFKYQLEGEDSKYDIKNVFTKYVLGARSYGAGGNGALLENYCIKPYGHYELSRAYSKRYKNIYSVTDYISGTKNTDFTAIKHYWPKQPCDVAEPEVITPAEAGKGGAILISW